MYLRPILSFLLKDYLKWTEYSGKVWLATAMIVLGIYKQNKVAAENRDAEYFLSLQTTRLMVTIIGTL